VLAFALVGSWLWFSCGPFTAGLWASAVIASAYVSRTRRLEQPPMKWPMRAALHALGALLVIGAFGAALDLANPAALASCDTQDGTRVLVALGALVAASLLTLTWPLRWLWVAWSAVMLLWCGRTGADCAGAWAARAYQAVHGLAPRQLSALERELKDLQQRVRGGVLGAATPPQPAMGSSGAGSSGSGSSGAGWSGAGSSGAGSSGSGASEAGSRGVGSSGSRRSGPGTSGGGRSAPAEPAPGEGQVAEGEAGPRASTPTMSGRGPDLNDGARREPTPIVTTSAEPRISVEEALRDPEAFFEQGSRVMLSGDLLFEFDEDVLRPGANAKLGQVAKLLRLDPQKRVLLEGHADTIGGDAYNQSLSERRAAAVRTWLIDEAHINPSQIDTVGFGSSRPIVPAARGPAAQQPNRRVEVRVLVPER
jgi:outer membrane protein OmpA-like peptidoglycan-associated protein